MDVFVYSAVITMNGVMQLVISFYGIFICNEWCKFIFNLAIFVNISCCALLCIVCAMPHHNCITCQFCRDIHLHNLAFDYMYISSYSAAGTTGMRIVLYCVSKNVPPLACYNLDIHDPITIIFGRILHSLSRV